MRLHVLQLTQPLSLYQGAACTGSGATGISYGISDYRNHYCGKQDWRETA